MNERTREAKRIGLGLVFVSLTLSVGVWVGFVPLEKVVPQSSLAVILGELSRPVWLLGLSNLLLTALLVIAYWELVKVEKRREKRERPHLVISKLHPRAMDDDYTAPVDLEEGCWVTLTLKNIGRQSADVEGLWIYSSNQDEPYPVQGYYEEGSIVGNNEVLGPDETLTLQAHCPPIDLGGEERRTGLIVANTRRGENGYREITLTARPSFAVLGRGSSEPPMDPQEILPGDDDHSSMLSGWLSQIR